MAIKKILVQRLEDGKLILGDAVEYEGALWLVTRWISGSRPNTESPEKLISLRGLKVQEAPKMYRLQADLFLTDPLSKAVLEGQTDQGHDVIDQPDITLLLQSTVIPETKH